MSLTQAIRRMHGVEPILDDSELVEEVTHAVKQDDRQHSERVLDHYNMMWNRFDGLREELETRIARDKEELRQVVCVLRSLDEARMFLANPNMPLASNKGE